MGSLEVSDLVVRLKGFEVHVDGVRVDGKVVLLGHNGSGKTTLLRCIAGLIKPLRGNITVNGSDVTGLPPERRSIAYMPQRVPLIRMRPREIVKTFTRMWGLDWERFRESPVMSRLLNKDHLSGGEYKVLLLNVCLMREPSVMLLDEPTSHLDWPNRKFFWAELKRVRVPFLYVTHDPLEAAEIGDEVIFMREGKIAGPFAIDDRPESLYEGTNIYKLYAKYVGV
ncbi:MAG: ATP-binding cassette domain-containing protein [Aigarchaeota archaeon]|nr:ATP-binding cassette domain-containing protein [Aigarchaeota archaeon]MDW8092789.1 ATP-binding cassette domain-containing protein [Nitrososphaerota archaeon]